MANAFKAIFAAFVLALAFTGHVVAGAIEDAEAAWRLHDLALLRKLAEHGNVRAQTRLGQTYFYSINSGGLEPEYLEAARWYRRAAEQGDPEGAVLLGALYEEGKGVFRSFSDAAKWYRLAANQGNSQAQGNLGKLYETGQGVLQDYAEAVKWYRLGANHDATKHAAASQAQYYLANMYANGWGVPRDYVQAHAWFNLAAAPGNYRIAVKRRDEIAAKMTPAQIAEAQKLAREWKPATK